MSKDLQPWVSESAKLPIAFAQVREDALIDLELISDLGHSLDVAMVASGGCTSAALVSSGRLSSLNLVDCNPAQIALASMKIDLLQNASFRQRMQVLGHAPMAIDERKRVIGAALAARGLPEHTFGPIDFVASVGPDHCGRYERVFHHLRERLSAHQGEITALLNKRSPARQSAAIACGTELGKEMNAAFDEIMSQPNLVALFGEAATNNRVMPFGQHFAWRTRHALSTLPARSNPYLAQVLGGRFVGATTFPWLQMPRAKELPAITCTVSPMQQFLEPHRESFDFVHLSNILDWLSPQEAAQTLDAAYRSLRRGGTVVIRQLNSALDVQDCCRSFRWLNHGAAQLHCQDRSYFYRHLHIGVKR